MKKIIVALLACIFLLNLNSCTPEELRPSYSIKDALKISAWVLDESIEGNVYHQDDSVYTLEQLNINEVKLMAPIGWPDSIYLDIFVEFNGIIRILAENNDMILSYKENYAYDVKFALEGFFHAGLIRDEHVDGLPKAGYHSWDDKVGTERYLTVYAYRFENEDTPIITAQLKLVLIEDWIEDLNGNKGFSSRCFSIELISYEYSDIYKLLDDIIDEEDLE